MIIKFESFHCNTRSKEVRVQISSGAIASAYVGDSDVDHRPFWKELDIKHATQAVLDRFDRIETERRREAYEEKKESE